VGLVGGDVAVAFAGDVNHAVVDGEDFVGVFALGGFQPCREAGQVFAVEEVDHAFAGADRLRLIFTGLDNYQTQAQGQTRPLAAVDTHGNDLLKSFYATRFAARLGRARAAL